MAADNLSMSLSTQYSHCLENKMFVLITDERERRICEEAAKMCGYDKTKFQGAILYLLESGRY